MCCVFCLLPIPVSIVAHYEHDILTFRMSHKAWLLHCVKVLKLRLKVRPRLIVILSSCNCLLKWLCNVIGQSTVK